MESCTKDTCVPDVSDEGEVLRSAFRFLAGRIDMTGLTKTPPNTLEGLRAAAQAGLEFAQNPPRLIRAFVPPDTLALAKAYASATIRSDVVANAVLAELMGGGSVRTIGTGDGMNQAGPPRATATFSDAMGLAGAGGMPEHPRGIIFFLARLITANRVADEKGVGIIRARRTVNRIDDQTVTHMAALAGLVLPPDDLPAGLAGGRIGDWIAEHQELIQAIVKILFALALAMLGL